MADEGSSLARTIAEAFQAGGIPAKVHGGKLFVEREDGWDGPIDPASARSSYLDDLRQIEARARLAASEVIGGLNPTERGLMDQHPSGYASLYLSEVERFRGLGYDERRARLYASVARSLSLWKELG